MANTTNWAFTIWWRSYKEGSQKIEGELTDNDIRVACVIPAIVPQSIKVF